MYGVQQGRSPGGTWPEQMELRMAKIWLAPIQTWGCGDLSGAGVQQQKAVERKARRSGGTVLEQKGGEIAGTQNQAATIVHRGHLRAAAAAAVAAERRDIWDIGSQRRRHNEQMVGERT